MGKELFLSWLSQSKVFAVILLSATSLPGARQLYLPQE